MLPLENKAGFSASGEVLQVSVLPVKVLQISVLPVEALQVSVLPVEVLQVSVLLVKFCSFQCFR